MNGTVPPSAKSWATAATCRGEMVRSFETNGTASNRFCSDIGEINSLVKNQPPMLFETGWFVKRSVFLERFIITPSNVWKKPIERMRSKRRSAMSEANALAVFENYKIRRVYDEPSETWFFWWWMWLPR